MAELSKYFRSESMELNRSEIKFADYNPRVISKEERDAIKKGVKQYGLLGGLIVNKQTGYTIVQGHQRVSVMDELMKYNPDTHENDYMVRADVIDVPLNTEKEINILLNNPNAQGKFDWDKIGELVNDGIDWKAAGLTTADLSMAGVDFLMRTDEQKDTLSDFDLLMKEENERHAAEVAQRKAEREELKAQERAEQAAAGGEQTFLPSVDGFDEQQHTGKPEMTDEEKKQHMKDVKQQVREQAIERAANESAYITLSFDDYENKMRFVELFNLNPNDMMAKGEDILFMLDSMQEGM